MTRVYHSGGFGFGPYPLSEPWARQSEVVGRASAAASPTIVSVPATPVDDATWSRLVKGGWKSGFCLTIDGIPWVLPDRTTLTVQGQSVRAPPDYGQCPALFLDESAEIAIDCDRESGLAAGRSLDLVLAWQALEDSGLTTTLFRRPTIRAALSSSVTTAVQSSLSYRRD